MPRMRGPMRRRRGCVGWCLCVRCVCTPGTTIPTLTHHTKYPHTPTQILLARPEFTALASSAAVAAKLAPLTLAQHLHAPFDAMQRYETQLQALLEATEKGHPDNGPLLVSEGGGIRVGCRTHDAHYTPT